MKESIIDNLYCPACQGKLECRVTKAQSNEIEEGVLICNRRTLRNYIETSVMLPPSYEMRVMDRWLTQVIPADIHISSSRGMVVREV